MTAFDLEEQERVDALKDWWKQNGTYVYIGLAAIIIAIFSVTGWREYQTTHADQAAEMFAQFQKAAESHDPKKTQEAADKITNQFPDSAYAAQAVLAAAQQSVDGNDTASAQASLKWVVDKSKSTQLQSIARLRLAALLLDQKKYDDALKLLDDNKDAAFIFLTADLKGDINAAQGKIAEARANYKLAVEKAPAGSPAKQLTQVKLDMLSEGK
ncbi:MAG: tetratricopeptide repeat protein [Pseudomonadota bacterium]